MRPELSRNYSVPDFNNYYWLKAELIDFCRANGLSIAGKKQELAERIEHFLETGEALKPQKLKPINNSGPQYQLTLEGKIPNGYKNDERHRAFFKSVIGERFKFNVIFMNWMKANAGKTYKEAAEEWLRIEAGKKSGQKYKIGGQFEYNQYTRDFFEANPGKNRAAAIKCWNYKKGMPGSNKYEYSDLAALDPG